MLGREFHLLPSQLQSVLKLMPVTSRHSRNTLDMNEGGERLTKLGLWGLNKQ